MKSLAKPIAGVAIAASMALVAWLALNPMRPAESESGVSPAAGSLAPPRRPAEVVPTPGAADAPVMSLVPHRRSHEAGALGEVSSAEPNDLVIVVIDGANEPVPGAGVMLTRPFDTAPSDERTTLLATDADGICRTDAPGNAFDVHAFKKGVGDADQSLVRESTPRLIGNERGIVLQLARATTIRGEVVAVDGSPLSGAEVICTSADPESTRVPLEPKFKVSSDGRYWYSVRDGGGFWLHATLAGKSTPTEFAHVEAGGECEVRLQFQDPTWVQGVVLASDGWPVEQAIVTYWEDMPRASNGATAPGTEDMLNSLDVTDARGQFRIDLTSSRGGVLVARSLPGSKGGSGYSDVILIPPEQLVSHQDVTVALNPPATISGRIHDASGAPLGGFVSAVPSVARDAKDRDASIAASRFGRVKNRGLAGGRFSVGPLHPAGNYDVTFSSRSGEAWSSTRSGVPAGTANLDVMVGPRDMRTSSIVGTVQASDSTIPMVAVRVVCVPRLADGRWGDMLFAGMTITDDHHAAFEFNRLSAVDDHLLSVIVSDISNDWLFPVRAGGSEQPVVLWLRSPGDLNVTVLDAAGKPLPWSRVELTPMSPYPDTPLPVPKTRVSRADASGVASLENLDAGRWRLKATRGASSAQIDVDVVPDATIDVTLTLSP